MGDEARAQRVDQLLLVCDVWILGRHLAEYLIPKHQSVLQAVRLGGAGDLLAAILLGVFERVAHDPLRAMAGKNRRLGCNLSLCPPVDAASNPRKFTLTIFSNTHNINTLGALLGH